MSEPTRKVGRPAGSLNKAAINKTKLIGEAITVERLNAYIDKIDHMIMNDLMSPAEMLKAVQLLLKYSVLTPYDILESETIKELGSKEEADKVLAALKMKLSGEKE